MSNSIITTSMQVTNTGGLDEFLTKDPETSLFSYSYKRITPYAKHTVMVPFNEKVGFGKTLTCTIPFLGDLVHTMHLYFRLPQLSPPPPSSTYFGWVNAIGYSMIESVQVRIGETVFDQHTGLFLEVLDYLSTPAEKLQARYKSVGRYDNVNVLPINALGEQDIYVPLQFWFNKKVFSSLPMISLTGQTLKIQVKLRPFESLVTYDGLVEPVPYPIQQSGILVDYFMLSEFEREIFKNEEQEYLIEQWQYQTFEITKGMSASKFTLDFIKCVKEIVFVLTELESEENNDFFNFGRRSQEKQGGELVTNIGLAFDGKTRLEKLPESFFRIVTPQQHHTFAGNRNIYVISFAHTPEINQPSGTANFSRYDDVELLLDFVDDLPACKLHVLAINYNKINFTPDGVQIDFVN